MPNALVKELDAIEQEINAKSSAKTKEDNTNIDELKNKDGQNKEQNNNKTVSNEKTVITDEMRKKLNIPDKFKYMEDVVVWGQESEKAITKAANEKKDALKEKEQAENEREVYKQEIENLKEELKKANKQEPVISKEEKQKMIDEFNEMFVEDPVKAIFKVMQKREELKKSYEPNIDKSKTNENKDKEKEQEEIEKVKKEFQQRANKEWEEISKDLNDEEKKELLNELNKLSQEKPYIISLYDLKDIYDMRKQKQEAKLKAEEEAKKKARTSQSSPQSSADIIKEDKIKKLTM